MKWFQVLLIVGSFYCNASGYRILGILPVPSKSHYYIGHNLLKGLAQQGHDVTVISPFKEEKPINNYKEVFLENVWVKSRESNKYGFNSIIFQLKFVFCMLRMCFDFRSSG